jgi:hypothetical protein
MPVLGAALHVLALVALPLSATASPPSHAEVVASSGGAARAVLARAGAESCLRGKLTKALLDLSSSCEREGRRDALCALADRAAVVTPMTLAFMDDTARGLLQLIDPGSDSDAAALPAEGN